jgi:hypothetical protein
MQMTVRLNLQQALLQFIAITLTFFMGSFLSLWIPSVAVFDGLMIIVFVAGCYCYGMRKAPGSFYLIMTMALTALLLLIPHASNDLVYARLHDVVLGGVIGLLSGLFIFQGRVDVDFQQGVIAVLSAYNDYLSAIVDLFYGLDSASIAAEKKKQKVEQVLQAQVSFFPEWVYERGFMAPFQQGHRHFLLQIERFGQVLFAMHHVARHTLDETMLASFQDALDRCVFDVKNGLTLLILRLELKRVEPLDDAFVTDFERLEAELRQAMPASLEMLDSLPDYASLAAFIFDLKDLQGSVFKLLEALR